MAVSVYEAGVLFNQKIIYDTTVRFNYNISILFDRWNINRALQPFQTERPGEKDEEILALHN